MMIARGARQTKTPPATYGRRLRGGTGLGIGVPPQGVLERSGRMERERKHGKPDPRERVAPGKFGSVDVFGAVKYTFWAMPRSAIPGQPLFSREYLVRLILPLVAEQFLAMTIGACDTLMVSSIGEAGVSDLVAYLGRAHAKQSVQVHR
ncbi:MAG: hypothetical protein K2N31_09740 [Treponemataceae bacterium]|nr:hypothetical protein [Treponemataceae bacterium]